MTKYEEYYGSLSPSLQKFLEMSPKKRDDLYGKNKAKLYQRIVNKVQESFRDAVLAYNRLPSEYSRKINLNMGYNMVQEEIFKQKSAKDRANFAINQARQSLRIITTELGYADQVSYLFDPDFERVQKWLSVLENFEPELKQK